MDETIAVGLAAEEAEEYRKKSNMDFCYETHKKVFENWTEGKPIQYWEEPNGVMCVRYESGKWWHYRNNNKISAETGETCLDWW